MAEDINHKFFSELERIVLKPFFRYKISKIYVGTANKETMVVYGFSKESNRRETWWFGILKTTGNRYVKLVIVFCQVNYNGWNEENGISRNIRKFKF
jgi:hypothetical protein